MLPKSTVDIIIKSNAKFKDTCEIDFNRKMNPIFKIDLWIEMM